LSRASGDAITLGTRRFVWWDGALWWRTYQEGGFDGYRTLGGRKLPCDTLARNTEKVQNRKDAP
jgi:hypothetical protein